MRLRTGLFSAALIALMALVLAGAAAAQTIEIRRVEPDEGRVVFRRGYTARDAALPRAPRER